MVIGVEKKLMDIWLILDVRVSLLSVSKLELGHVACTWQ